jgi:hypothetical protein
MREHHASTRQRLLDEVSTDREYGDNILILPSVRDHRVHADRRTVLSEISSVL